MPSTPSPALHPSPTQSTQSSSAHYQVHILLHSLCAPKACADVNICAEGERRQETDAALALRPPLLCHASNRLHPRRRPASVPQDPIASTTLAEHESSACVSS
jgi:hypothetical protein